MLFRSLLLLALSNAPAQAQTPSRLTLPQHPGAMVVDLSGGWEITESSAKPAGRELGIRAHDKAHSAMLAFLFLTPAVLNNTSKTCADAELEQVSKSKPSSIQRSEFRDDSEMATVTFKDHQSLHRYWGRSDQCLAIEIYSDPNTALNIASARDFLARQGYEPDVRPQAANKLMYAEILFHHHAYSASVPVYRDLLSTLSRDPADLVLRRIATDDLAMSMGISGDVDGARKLLVMAMQVDPDYALNYYNLACADAEQGKASAARENLQRAFQLRASLLPNEHFPNPTQDDSLQKLRSDKSFWDLATSISAHLQQPKLK